ncbi:Uncharacterised protein [Pseudomonas fluorescens]|uniref:Transmembrane protein n=1 Tax=Pseudomonas fluorescens TaxID=294 RepID=A0A379IGF9_PSEFL|nr:hypothetical protein [Pseudomonas fluorescens]AIG01998.1 hypothetical protein HZ99_07405 [Pseudomonas fluorescens]SUD31864.1 Uncharacterised protein [Pseudomonas fluorescens]
MRRSRKEPYAFKSWMIALLIALAFVAIGYGLRFYMEDSATAQDADSWPDLALFLGGYLFCFCLKPLQAAIQRKLKRRAFGHTRQKSPS